MNSDFVDNHFGLTRKKRKPISWKKYKYRQLNDFDSYFNAEEEEATTETIQLGEVYNEENHSKDSSVQPVKYLEHQIKDGDTLQKMSLLYQCPIAELKRANRLLNSQEFFALKKLQIPVKNFSILTEILPVAGTSNENIIEEDLHEQTRTFNLGISQVISDNEQSDANTFLKKMDEDLLRIRESTKIYKDSLEETAATLMSPQFKPLIVNERKLCSGDDCGLQWRTLIIIVIIFILILPIVSIIYIRFINPMPAGNYSTTKT